MQSRIMYIENKSDLNDRGDAWIAKVEFSKTGQTVYFNNQAFKKMKTGGISGNHYNIETGEEYWISGVKGNGQDRHWAGGGKVKIDETIINEYLSIVDFDKLSENHFDIVQIPQTNKSRFNQIENETSRQSD